MTEAKKLAILRAELRRVEGLRNPSSPGVSEEEYALMERAKRHGTIAALSGRDSWGEFSAARGLIRRGLAEKVDEGKRFLRIRLTPKGAEALRQSPEGRRPYGLRKMEGGRVLPLIYRETEDYEYNPFREYRENPLSGKAGLHVVARRHSPHPKYGWEYSFSYNSTRKNVVREVKTKRGVQTMLVSVTDWQEDAEKFFEDYDSGYYANTDLTIFALDAQGVKHPLTLDAVRRMADAGSLPVSLAANPRRR